MVVVQQGDLIRGASTDEKPIDELVGSEFYEVDTEDRYRYNQYGRWEFIPPISLKSKRIQTLFIPYTDQTGLIFGQGSWQNVNSELQSSGCMVYQLKTSGSEFETGTSASFMRLNDYAQVELLPKVQVIFSCDDIGTNTASFIGLRDDALGGVLNTTSAFIVDDVSVFGLGYRTSDTNFIVVQNDASGAPTITDTAIPRSTDVFMLEIEYDTTTSVRLSLFDINMELLYENTFTTEIPGSGIDLAFSARIQNANATVRYNLNIFDYVRLEKTRPALSATIDP